MNKIDYKSKNKNRKIDFSFDLAPCTPTIQMEAELKGGGGWTLHILPKLGKTQISLANCPYQDIFKKVSLYKYIKG